MNRVQKFKELRRFKIKLTLMVFVFILILFTGIGVVDYSMSSLLKGRQSLGIFSVGAYCQDYYKVSVFDKSLYINTKYISQDYTKLLKWIDTKKQYLLNAIKN